MDLVEAIVSNPQCKIFEVLSSGDEGFYSWKVEPLKEEILPEREGFYIIKAKNIITKDKVVDCYIDITMTERISDCTYFVEKDNIFCKCTHEWEGDVISAVPIACFGNYELFYSKINPKIGIDILKEGFSKSNNVFIAEDLAYILRDEGLNEEAIKYFEFSVNNGPSSEYIYSELAQLYKLENNIEKYKYYNSLFNEKSK